jgi:hypothetical protein
MNLPVAPALPDTSSIAAAASSAASASSLGAKNALTAQTSGDSSSTPTSFDHVFANVGDNGTQNSSTSGNTKAPAKTGKGACASTSTTPSGQTASTQTATGVTPGTLLSVQVAASALANAQTSPGTASSEKENPDKPVSHDSHKKQSDTDDNSSTAATTTTPSSDATALTVDQMAAALAATATTPLAIQNLNTAASSSTDGTDAASTLTLKGAKGRSVTEVLAQGTPVLNYQVAANSADSTKSSGGKTISSVSPTATSADASESSSENAASSRAGATPPSAAISAVQIPGTEASVQAAVSDSATTSSSKQTPGTITAANANKSIVPNAARTTDSTGWQKPVGEAKGFSEKFADNGSGQGSSGDDSSNRSAKNTGQAADNKHFNNSTSKVGTDTAIGSVPMTSNLHASATAAATSDVFATTSSSAASTTQDTQAVAVSHATALVHQINEIGEGLWRVDRQSVEVNFNFGDKDHLSVRVEYKNGQVQATFNTSSTELRTAITQAWNSQNSSSGDRSYKMADPVFTSSSNSSFSSGEDSSSNSRQFASFQEGTNFAGSSRSRSSASTVSAPASTTSRASLRPEVAGHLNAIV